MDVGLGELQELEGQGGLACWSSWGFKESDKTDWVTELNWTERVIFYTQEIQCYKTIHYAEELLCKGVGLMENS